MKFRTKAALKLAKLTKIDLASQALDDVTVYFLDGDELTDGIEVFDMDSDGNYIAFPDGSYKWGDKTVVISNGIVESITTDSSEQTEKEEIVDKDVIVEAVKQIVGDLADIVEEVKGNVDVITEELKLAKQENESLREEIKLAKQTSKRNFVEPNIKKSGDKSSSFDARKELEKFGIK